MRFSESRDNRHALGLLCHLAIAAVVLVGSSATAKAETVCTEAGCHSLDASVTLRSGEFQDLVAALAKVDFALSTEIEAEIVCDACPVQRVLEPYCLLEVSINPESRVKVAAGKAKLVLKQGEWNTYLVKVANLAGVTAPLKVHSEQLFSEKSEGKSSRSRDQWLEAELPKLLPLPARLHGDPLQYCVIRLRTDSVGKRTAVLAMDVGQGTADIGFRNDVMLTFQCEENTPADTEKSNVHAASFSSPTTTSRNARRPKTDQELKRWLQNMVWYHGFSHEQIQLATGLSAPKIQSALDRFNISPATKPTRAAQTLQVLPYPGGPHPRIGFLEGAIDPQRETKASVFTPWDPSSYVVLDVPEALWSNLGLTYLAHTHIPTLWEEQNTSLPKLEWQTANDGSLQCERELPNKITFGTKLVPLKDSIRMEMWLSNGTSETLTDLRVQNCALLKFAKGFAEQTNENKLFLGPYSACRNENGDRWIITAWSPIQRAWGNADCPCLHADPQFPDCAPGETKRLLGWFSFYEGTDIHAELERIEQLGWRNKEGTPSDETARNTATKVRVN